MNNRKVKFINSAFDTLLKYTGGEDYSTLKSIYNDATSLPLIFRIEGLRIGFMKLYKTESPFIELFLTEDFGLNGCTREYESMYQKLANFSIKEDHLYLGNCIAMAEEIKTNAQILLKPRLDELKRKELVKN